MGFKMVNRVQVTKYLLTYSKRIEAAYIYELGALVAELENHAKLNAEYKDQTPNLKGSIGGILLKDGKIDKMVIEEFYNSISTKKHIYW